MRSAATMTRPGAESSPGLRAPKTRPAPRPAAPRPSDVEIVAGLRRSDARALERLVTEYGPLIARWAGTCGPEAEDVVQDVLFRVWRAGRGLRPDTHLPGWLKTVTQNTIRNRWRTQVRKPSVPAGLEPPNAVPVDDPTEATDDRITIEEVFQTLAPREREVLRLLYVSDLPLEEVAQRLHASREATKSLAARARRRIRARLEQLFGTAASAATTLSMMADRVAQASEMGGRSLLGAVASTAVAVLTAGALTLAGSGDAPAPAASPPARVDTPRQAPVVRPVVVRTQPAPRPPAPQQPQQPANALKSGVVPATTQAGPPPSPSPAAPQAQREVERQQRDANRTIVRVESVKPLPRLPRLPLGR